MLRQCGGGAAEPAAPVAANVSAAEAKFHEFMQVANAPGLLDARTKKAMAIALSVITKCEPCLKSHITKAREMGFSQEEIDEAAWLAVAFGGAPLMMFYKALRRTDGVETKCTAALGCVCGGERYLVVPLVFKTSVGSD